LAQVPQNRRSTRKMKMQLALFVASATLAGALTAHLAADESANQLQVHGLRGIQSPTPPTAECIARRDAAANELNRLQQTQAAEAAKCDAEIKQSQEMVDTQKKTNEQVKAKVAKQVEDEAKYGALQHEWYMGIMCEKVYKSYYRGNPAGMAKRRIQLSKICACTSQCTTQCLQDTTECNAVPEVFETSLINLKKKMPSNTTAVVAKPLIVAFGVFACPQATPLENEVAGTKAAIAAKEKECLAARTYFAGETSRLKAVEQKLWTDYHGHMSEKPAIKIAKRNEVKGMWCGVLGTTTTCGEDRVKVIKATHDQKCSR